MPLELQIPSSVLASAVLVLGLFAAPANALDAIVLEVREMQVGGIPVDGASVRLDLLTDQQTRVTVTARGATLADPVGKLSNIVLVCNAPVIAEPRYGCAAGRLTGRGGPTGSLDMNLSAEMRTDTGVTTFRGDGLALAGTTAAFSGQLEPKGWQVKANSGATTVAALRKFATPWFQLPADITGDGKATISGGASDFGTGTVVDATLNLEDVGLTNEASTIVTDQMSAVAQLHARLNAADTPLQVQFTGRKGQVLVGPVLLDFDKNALAFGAEGVLKGDVLTIGNLHVAQTNLLKLTGTGSVTLAGDTPMVSGDFKIEKFEFPAAYTSYVQITLATSLLGDLKSSGSLSGELAVRDNGITTLHLLLNEIELQDRKDRFHLSKLGGEVNWTPAGVAGARASRIGWANGGAYGLSGGAAELEFLAQGTGFALTRPTKLPVFDGAIAIDTLAISNPGASNMEVAFKGEVEPISMPLLAKAFGWPEFAGTLAASIPGVTLKDDVLTFQGNVESEVFGGRIIGSNIRLQDPLGNFPQFFADVRARDLDLGLVTQTFEVGSITGRLEVDVLGLELFDWSPTSFDARLATPKGDKSKHRISAKAVSSLSNVGGGGGGVVNALQSGVLKFFDDYSYDKLGINCKLRGDICEMSGIEPAGIGYYIVKGAGLPRIDIVGNAGRVRWSQLVDSVLNTTFGDAAVQ